MGRDRPYRTSELLQYVALLGREFKTRGLSSEAESLRIYYWAIRQGHVGHGGDIRVIWSPDHVLECYAESRTMGMAAAHA